jgi:hypothetical protein
MLPLQTKVFAAGTWLICTLVFVLGWFNMAENANEEYQTIDLATFMRTMEDNIVSRLAHMRQDPPIPPRESSLVEEEDESPQVAETEAVEEPGDMFAAITEDETMAEVMDGESHDIDGAFGNVLGEQKNTGDNTLQDGAGDDILEQLKDDTNHEKLGPAVSTKLAEACDLLVRKGVTEEKLEELRKKYATPENCKIIGAPKTNHMIFASLPRTLRQRDLTQQKKDSKISAAMTAILQTMDHIKANIPAVPALREDFQRLTDALTLVSAVKKERSMKRREELKPALAYGYRNICSSNNPITEQLFGDKIEEIVKQQGDINKMSNKVLTKKTEFRGVSQGRIEKRGRGRGSTQFSRSQNYQNNYQQGYQQNGGQNFPRGQSQPRGRGRGNMKGKQ